MLWVSCEFFPSFSNSVSCCHLETRTSSRNLFLKYTCWFPNSATSADALTNTRNRPHVRPRMQDWLKNNVWHFGTSSGWQRFIVYAQCLSILGDTSGGRDPDRHGEALDRGRRRQPLVFLVIHWRHLLWPGHVLLTAERFLTLAEGNRYRAEQGVQTVHVDCLWSL